MNDLSNRTGVVASLIDSMRPRWLPALAIVAGLLHAAPSAVAAEGDRPRLYTNEIYIEDIARDTALPLSDPMAVFAFVLNSLPDRVKVYPTENYYYFSFYHRGIRHAGNIRLDTTDRDQGKLHFAYYEDLSEWKDKSETTYRLLDQSHGVSVEKIDRLVYRVSYGDKRVVFELNDLSKVTPPPQALGPDEKFLGPVFDESGIRFFLVFNPKLKIFHYVLDETVKVADDLFQSARTDRILIGKRTGFAYYLDHHLDRKILIGVFEGNTIANNYFDGPFDQLPDNFIEGDELRQAILAVDPSRAGKIDRFGGSSDGKSRFLIAPYTNYRTEDDLHVFHRCATSKKIPRNSYYLCFIVDEGEYGDAPALPRPLAKTTPKIKRQSTK